MPTMEEVAKQPRAQRLARMGRTADDLVAAIRDQSDAVLSRRPDPKSWAAKEAVCHLRDTEGLFMSRFTLILGMDEPKLPAMSPDAPDRWAEELQYLRHDAIEAAAAFRKRRDETLAFLARLTPEQWTRGAIHPARGRMTIDDFVALIAWHDDNHLDQLRRALDGKP